MSEAINMDSYQNGPGGGGVREVDFQRLTQNVGTNIQKILQNGRSFFYFKNLCENLKLKFLQENQTK